MMWEKRKKWLLLLLIGLLCTSGCTAGKRAEVDTLLLKQEETSAEANKTGGRNPAEEKGPSFSGIQDIYVVRGRNADYEGKVKAFDDKGEDITGDIQIDASRVILDECGEYPLFYRIEDGQGNQREESCRVFVVEKEAALPIILRENEAAFVRISYQSKEEISWGSGFLMELTGEAAYIVTNAHVVGEEEQVEVFFYEGSRAEGRVLDRAAEPDMAVVKVDRTKIDVDIDRQLKTVEADLGHWDKLDPDHLPAAGYRCLNPNGSLWVEEIGRLLKKRETTWVAEYPLVQYTMENQKGASGSAIIDESGKLLAMALGVSEEENTRAFWGIGLPDILAYYEEVTGRRPWME